MKSELIEALFARAKSEEMGVVILTNNAHTMVCQLRAFKRDHPEYKELIVAVTSDENTVAIVKPHVELNAPIAEEKGDLEE